MAKRSKKDKGKRPSMQDVADLAGVSKTTVSFVINQVPGSNIPPETQERVWKAVGKLDYRPNIMARSLRRQRSQTIGFIGDRVATTPFAGLMVQGAQNAAWEHEKILLLVNTEDDPEIEKAALNDARPPGGGHHLRFLVSPGSQATRSFSWPACRPV
jgi:LacI family transcriptional regulator